MAIKNKPTFDPYSLAEFATGDALKSGARTWRSQKWSCLAVTSIAILPVLITIICFDLRYLTLVVSGVMIPYCIAIIAPLVARDARGLSTDVRTRLRIVVARFPLVTVISLMLSSVVVAPALILLPIGLIAAYVGLFFGVFLASPLALALPICVNESTGFFGSIKRSLFLLKGRWLKSVGGVYLCVGLASTAAALRFFHEGYAIPSLFVEPLLISWAAVGLGALYLNLYDH